MKIYLNALKKKGKIPVNFYLLNENHKIISAFQTKDLGGEIDERAW